MSTKALILLGVLSIAPFITTANLVFAASQEAVLHDFGKGTDGAFPASALISDDAGNLYGTTVGGGLRDCFNQPCGVLFELSHGTNGSWREKVLHRFTGKDGANPNANLMLDATGALYGTTSQGGNLKFCQPYGCGTVFKLTPGANGKWSEKVLHNFCAVGPDCQDGIYPYGGLVSDKSGNLYGTTQAGGAYGYGMAFELAPRAHGKWKETVLHDFGNGSDGQNPSGSLIIDKSGRLYGTSLYGGTGHFGTVFRLAPGVNGKWTEKLLYSFTLGADGYEPDAGLVFDPAGTLYGTAAGGGANADGVVFQLAPGSNGKWTETVLYSFTGGADGDLPLAGVTFDAAGSLYGTTVEGGGSGCNGVGCGIVFQLTPGSDGKWTETVLYSFTGGADGSGPGGGVIVDTAGTIYGTTRGGGAYSSGVAFEVTP
jgi:uncharacterized repeat protein (TIGR03803 family)